MAKPPETYAPNQNAPTNETHPTWLSLWESWRRSRLRGQQRGMVWAVGKRPSPSRLTPCHLPQRGRQGGVPLAIRPLSPQERNRAGQGSSDTYRTSARIVRPHCGPKKGQSSAKLNCPDGRHIPFHTPQRSTRLYPSVIWMVRLL